MGWNSRREGKRPVRFLEGCRTPRYGVGWELNEVVINTSKGSTTTPSDDRFVSVLSQSLALASGRRNRLTADLSRTSYGFGQDQFALKKQVAGA